MKIIHSIQPEPVAIAFGMRRSGGQTLTVARNASAISLISGDGSAAELPAASASAAGVLSAADKAKLDSQTMFASSAQLANTKMGSEPSLVQTAGHGTSGDGGAATYARRTSEPAHDGKLQSADGAWWELLPENGAFNARAFGTEADFSVTLEKACNAAVATDVRAVRVEGEHTISSRNWISVAGPLRLFSEGGALINLAQTIDLRHSEAGTVIGLAADASIGDTSIVLVDATGVQVHDRLFLHANDIVETGWNTRAQCMRRVLAIDGTTVHLDQPLKLRFRVADNATCAVRPPFTLYMDNIHWKSAPGPNYHLNVRDADGRISRCIFEGDVPGWPGGDFQDVLTMARCDGMELDHCRFIKGRYNPSMSFCRNIVVRNFEAREVRHMDASGWSEGITFEDGIGIATESLIQSHPCFDITFRRVRDSVAKPGIFGMGIRALGFVVEDCEAFNTDGVVGISTGYVGLSNDYAPLLNNVYTGRIRNFRSSTAIIPNMARNHKLVTVEDCVVPSIDADLNSNGTADYNRITVSPSTVLTVEDGTTGRVGFYGDEGKYEHRIEHSQGLAWPGCIELTPYDDYAWDSAHAPVAITAITQSNPGVVTAAAHGLSDGDFVRIAIGKSGSMTQLHGIICKVANATADTFALTTPGGVAVDTTGYTAFNGTGKNTVTRQRSGLKHLNTRRQPAIQWNPRMHFRGRIHASPAALGATSLVIPVKLSTQGGGSAIQLRHVFGEIIATAEGSHGRAQARYRFMNHYQGVSGYPRLSLEGTPSSEGGTTISLGNPIRHGTSQIADEGFFESSVYGQAPQAYDCFDVSVGVGSSSHVVHSVELEFILRRHDP